MEDGNIPLGRFFEVRNRAKWRADAFLAGQAKGIDAGWSATAARYQAMADQDAKNAAQLERYWSATAIRYQAMADAFLADQAKGIEAGWSATAARYQALAEHYMAMDQ